jgi:hypothetical protein
MIIGKKQQIKYIPIIFIFEKSNTLLYGVPKIMALKQANI